VIWKFNWMSFFCPCFEETQPYVDLEDERFSTKTEEQPIKDPQQCEHNWV
jgi:hypothetical protein